MEWASVGAEHGFDLALPLVLVFAGSGGAELRDLDQRLVEFLGGEILREVLRGGGDAAVSKLVLHGAEVVGCLPDILSDGAAKIMDAEFGANSGSLLERFPLLGEARARAGAVAGEIASAEDVHDWRVGIGAGRERGEGGGDLRRDRERLVHVALGVEGHGAVLRVVVGRRERGRGAVAESEIGAEQDEEAKRRTSGGEQLAAFFVGGDG